MKENTKIVDEKLFIHVVDKNREYFQYTDDNKWAWILQRHVDAGLSWSAYVSKPGKYNSVKGLNNISREDGLVCLGKLSGISTFDTDALLQGLVKLVNIGEWPEDIVVDLEKYEEWEKKYEREN